MKRISSLIRSIAKNLCFYSLHLVSLAIKPTKQKKTDINVSQIHNILIIDIGLLGDLLMTTPLISGIKECMPNTDLTLVCTPWAVEAVKNNPLINRTYVYDAFWENYGTPKYKNIAATLKLIRYFRQHSYDLAFVVTARQQPFVNLIGYLTRAKYRIGLDYPLGRRFLTHAIKDSGEHLTKVKLNMLEAICPEKLFSNDISYALTKESIENAQKFVTENMDCTHKRFICITPSTMQVNKRWMIDSWAGLVNRLTAEGFGVLIGGAQGDLEYNDSIYREIENHELCKQRTGQVSLNEFAALMKLSLCLVTVDSAPVHLASALKIPCVVLFSRMHDYERLKPTHPGSTILHKEVDCALCIKGCNDSKCMSFSVEEVYEAVKLVVQ